eukprot:Nk52_evm8s326 gene=Nk52_evmTU8s326
MANAPNLGILIIAQLLSTIGDAFGQRVSRVDHKGNYARMMISIAIVSAVQMIILVGILQIELPLSLTSDIYDSSTNEPTQCYEQVDITWTDVLEYKDCVARGVNGTVTNSTSPALPPCDVVDCPSQGSSTMLRFLIVFPLFFVTGVVNTIYYVGEALLYREPLGLIFIVVSALSSSFLIRPINIMFGLDAPDAIPGYIMALGMVGVILCVIEVNSTKGMKKRKSSSESTSGDLEGASASAKDLLEKNSESDKEKSEKGVTDIAKTEIMEVNDTEESGPSLKKKIFTWSNVMYSLRIVFPFVLLSICYALWFVLMKYFNDVARANAWGYNAIDQGILPLAVIPFLFVVLNVQVIPFTSTWHKLTTRALGEEKAQHVNGNEENRPESFSECLGKWKEEVNVFNVFMYRLFINSRAFVYTYLAVLYDMNVVYLEVQLLRVIMSWLGSILLCFLFPKFIQADKEEVLRSFNLINICLKLVGTGLAVAALVLLNV